MPPLAAARLRAVLLLATLLPLAALPPTPSCGWEGAASASLVPTAPAAGREPATPRRLTRADAPGPDRIVNGLISFDYPTTVALVQSSRGVTRCSGILIGCRTVLTAAHCVCNTNGSGCGPAGPHLVDPATMAVFAQSAGILAIDSIDVPPTYLFGVGSDVALLHLSGAVDGLVPTRINTVASPGFGETGHIVGFGISSGGAGDGGVKRVGTVSSAPCAAVPESTHVCWNFEEPLGAPGTDSNTCSGDSGGPLLMDLGSGIVVAGVTSGGISGPCLPSDNSFDADVFVERNWIEAQGGADLASTGCGRYQATLPGTEIFSAAGTLDAVAPEILFELELPDGLDHLRVTLNGDDQNGVFANQFDLYVRRGSPPSDDEFDCRSILPGVFEACDVPSPPAGTWFIRARREQGSGLFQATTTLFSTVIFADGFESGDTSTWF